jgi:hypothetical protein
MSKSLFITIFQTIHIHKYPFTPRKSHEMLMFKSQQVLFLGMLLEQRATAVFGGVAFAGYKARRPGDRGISGG